MAPKRATSTNSAPKKIAASPPIKKKAAALKPKSAAPDPVERESLEAVWIRLVKMAKSQAAKATFEGVEPVRFEGDSVVVRSSGAPMPRGLLDRIAKRLSDAVGRGVKVDADTPVKAAPIRRQRGSSTDVDDPRVDLAKELFDASVIDVRKHEHQEERDV
ncbi:MAG: hypothetical protein HOJ54_03980 [Phycisphaerae bacterium]|nr:hypothetical protein [Phycisphaerae bacterium]